MIRPLSVAGLLMLGACASSLPPVPELRPVPGAWTANPTAIAPGVEDRWWLAFADPVLTDLVAAADLGDDPMIAEARLMEAVSRLESARARLRPELAAAGEGEAGRVDGFEQDQIRGLLSLAWSPDLNGAGAARARAAMAALSAEAARAAAVRQATRGTAVGLYIALREAQAQAAAAERSIVALSGALALAESRERAGLTSGFDRVATGAQLAAARVRPSRALEAEATARLGLEALLGLAPGALDDRPGDRREPPSVAGPDVLLVPAAVLARRPDLIAAEWDLAVTGYEAEAARRDFWPTVSLSAVLGAQDIRPETPVLMSGGLARVGAGLASPLLSFGRLGSARAAADARRRASALTYRQAATLALAEVERALAATEGSRQRLTMLEEARRLGGDRLTLASSRYRAGLTSVLEVLAAEEALADSDLAVASAQAEAARAHVALSLAMGLGTSPDSGLDDFGPRSSPVRQIPRA
ncbi:MAG: TolC family protein [Caulobacteraceae bacterium]|nr:TolC family protein [Caulobacteraceae bacterium]